MMCNTNLALVLSLMMASSASGQFANWLPNQANTSICYWKQPRAALIRDTVYLDGGQIVWSAGFESGEYGRAKSNDNSQGFVLSYNLSRSFSWPDTNVTGVLVKDKRSKAYGADGNARGPGLNFQDGAMLANDFGYFLYGGLMFPIPGEYEPPGAHEILSYQAIPDGLPGNEWKPSFNPKTLPDDITRYITFGGAVNAPSEKKSWYFSGLTSPTRGPIYLLPANDSVKALNVSRNLITLDTEDTANPKWRNDTIENKGIKGRANPEVVWVPIGKQGILVVLGGVVYPDWTQSSPKSLDEDASEKESPEFMQTIDIYDVANNKWYRQPTTSPGTKGPGTRARGCAVVAPSSDHTVFNIYYYGGYDGIHPRDDYNDDVWVLSLPSFTWTQLNKGTPIHARAGHKCFLPYPDQMMVFGGYPSLQGVNTCLDKGPVVIFNLTSGEWMDSYDPNTYGEYGVPDKVQAVIGGNAAGAATKTAPAAGWQTSALGEIFKTSYDHSKIKTYWPYPAESTSTSRPEIPPKQDEDKGKSGLPSWVAPVIGVVVGLVLLTGAIVLFCLWRKRWALKKGPSEHGTEDAGMRVISWMRNQLMTPPPVDKAPTVTTTEMSASTPELGHTRVVAAHPASPRSPNSHLRYEMDATQVMELDDTSPPVELHGGFAPIGVSRKHSSNNGASSQARSLSKPSSASGGNSDFNDTVSQSSGPTAGAPVETGIVDSPTLANTESPSGTTARCTSDVSMITNRMSHLRNHSDATVSSEGTHAEPRAAPERLSHPGVQSIAERVEDHDSRPSDEPRMDSGVLPQFRGPVSPPTAEDAHAEGYFSVQQPIVSPIGKSAFPEDEDPLGRK